MYRRTECISKQNISAVIICRRIKISAEKLNFQTSETLKGTVSWGEKDQNLYGWIGAYEVDEEALPVF
jgi:hypothetical protein